MMYSNSDVIVITMDMVDLEHCGFDYELFKAELEMAGITKPAAQWPVVLMVNFRGGHVVSGETSEQTLARMAIDKETFEQAVERVLDGRERDNEPQP